MKLKSIHLGRALKGLVLIIILAYFFRYQTGAEPPSEIDLDKLWKVKLGDSIAFSKVDFSDEDWGEVTLDQSFDKQGYSEYDGVLWYRYKVVIPSSLKSSSDIRKLQFHFGAIDDSDRFYLNGSFVGGDNKFGNISLNDSVSYATVNRVYELDIKDNRIFWDQENLIAIRVLDLGSVGGMKASAYIASSEFSLSRTIKLTIDKGWKFHTGDSVAYADPDYDDFKWRKIEVAQNWESQGYPYDGYAWYRIHVKIPSGIKQTTYKGTDKLQIYLGKIDDNDQVFFNGIKIGENNRNLQSPGRFNDDFRNGISASGLNRMYTISLQDKRIKWDENNVIAIRVFDRGGGGGLIEAMPYIKAGTIEDDVEVDRTKFYVINEKNLLDTVLRIYNKNKSSGFTGCLVCRAKGVGSSNYLDEKVFKIHIKPADSLKISFSLPYSLDSVRISLGLVDESNINVYRCKYVVPFLLN